MSVLEPDIICLYIRAMPSLKWPKYVFVSAQRTFKLVLALVFMLQVWWFNVIQATHKVAVLGEGEIYSDGKRL